MEPIVETALLQDYDSYYHPGERRPPLPVLRVKFGDPDATWFYVDPHMGQVVMRFTRRGRLQRWIYHGLHSLDFNFWYYNGPVWRATMVAKGGAPALGLAGLTDLPAFCRVTAHVRAGHQNGRVAGKLSVSFRHALVHLPHGDRI